LPQNPIDPIRLADLMKNHAGSLCQLADRWAEFPEDCVQEAFISLASAIPPPDNPTAWLYLVTKRKAINQCRESGRRKIREKKKADQTSQTLPTPEQIAGNKDESEKLVRLVQDLPEPQREIVILRTWGELGWREIHEQTQIPPTTVQRHYKSALTWLKEKMESTWTDLKN